jgi:hypothetical protein
LLALSPTSGRQDPPEKQFKPLWLPWEQAFLRPSYEAEREWLRRAWAAWQALAPR